MALLRTAATAGACFGFDRFERVGFRRVLVVGCRAGACAGGDAAGDGLADGFGRGFDLGLAVVCAGAVAVIVEPSGCVTTGGGAAGGRPAAAYPIRTIVPAGRLACALVSLSSSAAAQ